MTIQEKAEQYLAENENIKQVFATSDGFLFLEKKDAQNHAQTLSDYEVQTFSQDEETDNEADEATSILNLSIKKMPKRVKQIGDVELLEALILEEENGKNRPKVLELLAKRIEELKKEV